ncbi:hypothetical protein T4E_11383 [Trichinella pseudospiralis]|uniref:Uncharacterized protein n=1 Tax=Trichinella pseudospiralis TaxID=6337 RepID=A0A0V0Y661_TRIPS|nr:hypothetical protein T4E_11383 [Trichinella pseudospiralis]
MSSKKVRELQGDSWWRCQQHLVAKWLFGSRCSCEFIVLYWQRLSGINSREISARKGVMYLKMLAVQLMKAFLVYSTCFIFAGKLECSLA